MSVVPSVASAVLSSAVLEEDPFELDLRVTDVGVDGPTACSTDDGCGSTCSSACNSAV